MKNKLMILAAAVTMALAPMTASAARIFVGGPVIGASFYGPYWGPAYAYPLPVLGEVKIDTRVKDAEVFVNGAFAGITKDAKTLHLRPGSYNIEVRYGGQSALNQQVFVTAGKTLHLQAAI
jgi:hypothetical protein